MGGCTWGWEQLANKQFDELESSSGILGKKNKTK